MLRQEQWRHWLTWPVPILLPSCSYRRHVPQGNPTNLLPVLIQCRVAFTTIVRGSLRFFLYLTNLSPPPPIFVYEILQPPVRFVVHHVYRAWFPSSNSFSTLSQLVHAIPRPVRSIRWFAMICERHEGNYRAVMFSSDDQVNDTIGSRLWRACLA